MRVMGQGNHLCGVLANHIFGAITNTYFIYSLSQLQPALLVKTSIKNILTAQKLCDHLLFII